MAKYYRFHYSSGYPGADSDEVIRIHDEAAVKGIFDDWYEAQRVDCGSFKEISEKDALYLGIDEDLTD